MKAAHLLLTLALLVVQSAGCTDIPPAKEGGRIQGTITYQGTAHLQMHRPAIRVMLLVDFPPSGGPLGFQMIEPGEQAGFPTHVDYELIGILPYRYKVFAQLMDLDDPGRDATTLPMGGYPNTCALPGPMDGLVTVESDVPATGINLYLYDNGGAGDPCHAPVSVCPQPGRSTMNLTVESSLVPGPSDRLVVAMFSTFPSTTPSRSRLLSGDGLVLPKTLVDNAVDPGSYAALYVCLDVGGDSGQGSCTMEDAFVLSVPTEPYVFPEGTIVNLVADLDARQVRHLSIDLPTIAECP